MARSVLTIRSAGKDDDNAPADLTRERSPGEESGSGSSSSTADEEEASKSDGIIFLDTEENETIRARIPTGTRAGRWTIVASAENDAKLRRFDKTKPIIVSAKGTVLGWQDHGIQDFDFEFRELWLGDRIGPVSDGDPSLVAWSIEDNRRWMRGIRSFGEMNVDRFANEFEDFPGEDADSNFAQFHRIPKFSLLRNTCQEEGGTGFAR